LIRLNSKLYNDNEFEKEGIKIYDLEYPDGSNPSDKII
jgi:protein-tyrosine phosphatase